VYVQVVGFLKIRNMFCTFHYSHPRSYVVGGFKANDVSRDSVSRYRLSHECSVKMGTVVPGNLI
jgi:hypothetical protein